MSGNFRNQIEHQLIVDFQVRHSHTVIHFKSCFDFLEDLIDGSWNNSSVLVVLRAATHCESLAWASLPIYKDSAVESFYDRLDNVSGAVVKHLILGSIVKNLVESETPLLLLIVYCTTFFLLWNLDCDSLGAKLTIWRRELHFRSSRFEGFLKRSWRWV